MSLFDTIRCEYPLPDLDDPTTIEFQSKSLECLMNDYRITKEGRLLRIDCRYEDHSDPNAKGLLRFAGCMTPIPIGDTDMNYHGWLNFYGNQYTGELFLIDPNTGKDTAHPEPVKWYEYNAKFTDGTLVELTKVDDIL